MIPHEPECLSETDRDVCICDLLKTAYRRGRVEGFRRGMRNHAEDMASAIKAASEAAYQRGYLNGYNDAKRTRVELEAMFGPYTPPGVHPETWFQHGKGENP